MFTRSILLIAALAASPALAAELFRGDFETGDLSQWSSVEAGEASHLSVVSDPVAEGRYAMKVVLATGDVVYNGTRNEVDDERDDPGEGEERYYHWRTLFPSDFETVRSWEVFTQWHQYEAGGSPPIEFDVADDALSLVTHRPDNGGETTHWSTPLVRGVWHDFLFHVRWSSDASVGFIELTYDGAVVLPKTSVATLYPGDTVYLKQGLYRDSNTSLTQTAYHDGMRVGTTLADVQFGATGGGDPDAGVPPRPDVGADAGSAGGDPGSGGVTGSGADGGSSGPEGPQTADAGVSSAPSTSTRDGGAPLTHGSGASLSSRVSGGCSASAGRRGRAAWAFIGGPLAVAALLVRRRRRAGR